MNRVVLLGAELCGLLCDDVENSPIMCDLSR
jgi:hypothetical protein